jgi:hypothetical protein
LAVDGAVGTQTRDALAAAVGGVEVSAPPPPAPDPLGTRTLRWGDRGDDVAAVQQALSRRGFDPGPADGVFGGMTATAVRAFQAARGLGVDGVVGTQTRVALSGDTGAGDVLEGGVGFDTCNDPNGGDGCESVRGIRAGAPWSAGAADEWRPLVNEVFSAWDLEEEIERAVAVVACESLGDPFVTTPSRNGSEVIGLFQHSSTYWDDRAADAGIPGGSPLAPRDNVTVAAWLVRRSIDLGDANGPWHHFDCGRLLGFWPDGA